MKDDLPIFILCLMLTFTGYAIGRVDSQDRLEQEHTRRVHAEIVAEYANNDLNAVLQDLDYIKERAGHLEQQLIECKYY